MSDEPELGLRYRTTDVHPYDVSWPRDYDREAELLRSILGERVAGLEHVASTAVPGLAAKPILDIAIAIAYKDAADVGDLTRLLTEAGYEFRGNAGDDGGLVFVKGPEPLFRTHHVHLVEADSLQWHCYLVFRDALRADGELREQYAAIKADLAARFPLDRPSYASGKTGFIHEVLKKAGWEQGH